MKRPLAARAFFAGACSAPRVTESESGAPGARFEGFDAPEDPPVWRTGDRAAFELVHAGGEARRRWRIELELLPIDGARFLVLERRTPEDDVDAGAADELVLYRPARALVR